MWVISVMLMTEGIEHKTDSDDSSAVLMIVLRLQQLSLSCTVPSMDQVPDLVLNPQRRYLSRTRRRRVVVKIEHVEVQDCNEALIHILQTRIAERYEHSMKFNLCGILHIE